MDCRIVAAAEALDNLKENCQIAATAAFATRDIPEVEHPLASTVGFATWDNLKVELPLAFTAASLEEVLPSATA